MFWLCSFANLLVKGTDNFWKVLGIIGGFNKWRSNIASGVEKIIDELMIAIQFRTTPKGHLTH